MRFNRKSNCEDCPLNDMNKVLGEGKEGGILFIGEAPGAYENELKKPFVGPAGNYFNWGLSEANIIRFNQYITNVILCQPPKNKIDSYEAVEGIKNCTEGLFEEIDQIKPKVIVLLGNTPCKIFDITEGITKVRGSVYEYKGIPVIPTLHPSYLNRNVKQKSDGTKAYMKYVWIADLKKAKDLLINGYKKLPENFQMFPTIDQLEHKAKTIKNQTIAIDIEATSLNPFFSEIVVIGVGLTKSTAFSIPLLKQGNFNYFENGEIKKVKEVINELFTNNKLSFQNALYDIRVLRYHGYKIDFNNIAHDSMLLHHAVSPELPHNLGFITSLYGQTPYWKEDLLSRDGKITEMDDEVLRRYNLRDTVVLNQIIPGLMEDLECTETYQLMLKMIKPICKMVENGFNFDKKKLIKWKKEKENELVEVEKKLYSLGKLPKEFNLSSQVDLRLFLFGIKDKKYDKTIDLEKKKKGTNVYQKLFNLNEVLKKTKPIYVPKNFKGRKTKGGVISTNEQGLLSLQRNLQNRINQISYYKRPTEEHFRESKECKNLLKWIGIFYNYRKLIKLLTLYGEKGKFFKKIDPDGKIRTSLLIHGTATGRLASRDPNLQNPPKTQKLKDPIAEKKRLSLRKCFIASENNILLSADYSNLEVRVLAYISNDDVLINALENGINIHDLNTKILFNLKKTDKLWSLARRASKIFMFGGISYGGGDNEIYEKVILECPELSLTFADFKTAKKNYMKEHPKYTEWRNLLEKQIISTRRVKNAFGRERTLMGEERDIIKEGINFPIQSTASDVINYAMIRIDNEMEKKGLSSQMILQVHDQLIFDAKVGELDKLSELVKNEMEKKVLINGREISFPVDLEYGPSWGELEEYKK